MEDDNLSRSQELANQIITEMTMLALFGTQEAHHHVMNIARDIVDQFRANVGPPDVKFWYHPESECVLTTFGEQQHNDAADAGAEEISIDQWDEYAERCIANDEDDEL